ncbi:MAG TPA: C-terminal helicase domain-containing protein, partial [Spirochaetia bacterium]|nr:C-terminal helicase domain-containing protein [Spirochaetia bacterium]
ASTKEKELLARLDEISQEGLRALVFSQFVSALSAFRDRAAERGVATLYLDGQTRDRDALIDRFQRSQQACVFFVSLRAGGTGINLTAADHVFICDPWWNPQVERQAVDRAHRIGRERPVIVTRLVTAGTIEQKVLELQDQKRALAADLISENAGGIDLAAGAELLALFER